MNRKQLIWVACVALLLIPNIAQAQLWSGIIDPSRAIDWTSAGATIINRSTVCSTPSLTAGSGAASANATAINNAMSACPSGRVVSIPSGTWYVGSSGLLDSTSNITIRGAGPGSTDLIFTAENSCGGWYAGFCVWNGEADCCPPDNISNWTAGYSVGTTSITLSAPVTGSTAPAAGQLIFLDQLDDSNTDTGQIWECEAVNVCSEEVGAARSGRGELQVVQITSVSGTGPYTVGIAPAIRMPNWSSGKSPQAWWANNMPVTNVGIENLTLDFSSMPVTGNVDAGVMFLNSYGLWAKNIRTISNITDGNHGVHEHYYLRQSAHATVRDSYMYGEIDGSSQNYGVSAYESADDLVENNITQHVAQPFENEDCTGCVYGYNYSVDDYYTVDTTYIESQAWQHSIGNAYILWEENQGSQFGADDIHGTSHFVTAFRNYWTGTDGSRSSNTTPVVMEAYSRYYNLVGNVLGSTTVATNYQSYPTTATQAANTSTTWHSIYSLAYAQASGGTPPFNNDLTLTSTLMRWGNYDTVSAGIRFISSEVPSGLSQFANLIPVSQALPTSFYQSTKPSWWGTTQWPAIGPDVTGGNIAGVGGHANSIPAQLCYNNTPRDSNGILMFNANACYTSASVTQPAPPSNLAATVN